MRRLCSLRRPLGPSPGPALSLWAPFIPKDAQPAGAHPPWEGTGPILTLGAADGQCHMSPLSPLNIARIPGGAEGSWASFQGRPAWSPRKAWSPPLGPVPGTQPPFLALTTQGWPVTLGDNSTLSARLPCLQRQLVQSGDCGRSPDLLRTHCVTVANLSPLITCGC